VIFKRMDYSGNNKLDPTEFEQALAAFGLFPKKVELQALIKYYDVDGDGQVSYDEFIRGLRDELTERRLAMVLKAFNMLDRDGSGQITVSDIINTYDVSTNPAFIERRKTKEQLLAEFLDNFEGAKGNRDGIVTQDEFIDYYTDLSMSVPNDDYFVAMMETAWQCPEREDGTSKAVVQKLIREVRDKVLELCRGDVK